MRRAQYTRAVAAILGFAFLAPPPARSSVDLTGTWSVVLQSLIGPLNADLDVVQSGTALTLTYTVEGGAPQGPHAGTIDPDTGAFTIPLPDTYGPVPGLGCTGNGITGTAPGGQTMSGTWVARFFKTTPPTGCFDGGGPFTGTRDACGNGTVEASEACDDGNTAGGDCCAADCQSAAPDATPCDDGDACTTGDQCVGGTCAGSGTLVCDPCEVCAPAGCTLPAAPGCQAPLAGGKATIALRDDALDAANDKLSWRWRSSGPVPLGDFGNPLATSDYTLCVIDRPGGTPTLRMSRTAPAGGVCGTMPCWKDGTRYGYKNKAATPHGLTAMTLGASAEAGRGKLTARGKGSLLGVPTAVFTAPVTVRLVRHDASVCWEATYSIPQVNDGVTFKAKSD